MKTPEKPTLILNKGRMTLEQVIALFEQLTGKKATPEGIEKARIILEKRKKPQSDKPTK